MYAICYEWDPESMDFTVNIFLPRGCESLTAYSYLTVAVLLQEDGEDALVCLQFSPHKFSTGQKTQGCRAVFLSNELYSGWIVLVAITKGHMNVLCWATRQYQ